MYLLPGEDMSVGDDMTFNTESILKNIDSELKIENEVISDTADAVNINPSTETAKEIVKDTGSKPEDTFGPT